MVALVEKQASVDSLGGLFQDWRKRYLALRHFDENGSFFFSSTGSESEGSPVESVASEINADVSNS